MSNWNDGATPAVGPDGRMFEDDGEERAEIATLKAG